LLKRREIGARRRKRNHRDAINRTSMWLGGKYSEDLRFSFKYLRFGVSVVDDKPWSIFLSGVRAVAALTLGNPGW